MRAGQQKAGNRMARITGHRRTEDRRQGTLDSIAGDRRQEDRRRRDRTT